VPGNSAFIKSETTLSWLGQFDLEDQPTALAMLRAMTLVSRDAFTDRLRALALRRLCGGEEPLGLYAERELLRRKGVPNRLFKETKTKVRRAFGIGPQPVRPTKAYDPDVGSEGLVAQLVSELCREYPKRFYNHPGPDAIRKHKIRRFILLTDFIGSGRRARTYLQAAWRVRSVRSWWSAKLRGGLSFEVLAYAAASVGRSRVEDHPSKPAVHVVVGCPTIENAFGSDLRARVRGLCIRYDPGNHDPVAALGYEGTSCRGVPFRRRSHLRDRLVRGFTQQSGVVQQPGRQPHGDGPKWEANAFRPGGWLPPARNASGSSTLRRIRSRFSTTIRRRPLGRYRWWYSNESVERTRDSLRGSPTNISGLLTGVTEVTAIRCINEIRRRVVFRGDASSVQIGESIDPVQCR
jgi:hypothetical protein